MTSLLWVRIALPWRIRVEARNTGCAGPRLRIPENQLLAPDPVARAACKVEKLQGKADALTSGLMSSSMPSPQQIADNAARALAEAEARLAPLLTGVDARAVLASYALSRLSGMSGKGPERHSRPGPVAIEYAAWLLLPHFGAGDGRDSQKIQEAIDAIEACNDALSLTEVFAVSEVGEKYDRLDVHLRLHSGIVRGSAYPQQLVQRFDGVLKPFEGELAASAGVGPLRAFEIARAIGRQIEENIHSMRQAYRDAHSRGQAIADKGSNMTEADYATLAEISAELQKIVGGMEGDWAASFDQVAARVSGLQRAEWDALRETVGLTPASRAQIPRLVDVQDRPLFFLSDDHAVLVHIIAVFDAIFVHFDDLARSIPGLMDRYGRQVAQWMEAEMGRFLRRIFPAENVLQGACFPDPDHPGGETEADTVVVWGPFLVVAEAKGKRIARQAMRGSRGKLKQTLRNNVEDAFYQARRVVQVLERDGKITFKEKATGRTVEVDGARIQRVMPISATLQHLAGIPTQLALAAELGLFKGKAYPWSVSIDDLEVVTRFVGFPDAFLHYIERRTAHQSSDVMFNGDELDIFAHYLDNRLHPAVYEGRDEIATHAGARGIAFHGGEERFEKVYFAEWQGEPVENLKVELGLPAEIHAVLQELRQREDDGARWIAFALLGLSPDALNRVARAIQDLRTQQLGGKRMQRVTAREGDIVVNVMGHAGLDGATFHGNTLLRTRLEHYRLKPRATLTLGFDLRDAAGSLATASWAEGSWEKEEVMEELLAADREKPRTMQLLRKGTKPGRNDACPCGSGKKFKHCCLGLLTFQHPAQSPSVDRVDAVMASLAGQFDELAKETPTPDAQ